MSLLAGLVIVLLFAASASAKTIYATGTSGVAALTVNSDGTLTPVAGSPFPAGLSPEGVALTPDGTKLYVANQSSDSISAFRVLAGGGLQSVGPPTPTGASGPIALVTTPDGRHLYVVNGNSISGYEIAANGSLTALPGSPFATNPTVEGLRVPSVSADGRFLLVPGNSTTNVAAMRINQDGSLGAPGASAPTGGIGVVNTALAPNANRIYVNNWFSNSIAAFNFDATGALTPVAGTPFSTGAGTQPMPLRPSLSGTRLYAGFMATDQIAAMVIGPGGALASGPVVPAGTDPQFLAQTSEGLHLYGTIDAAAGNVPAFDVAGDGTLSLIPGSPFTSGAGSPSFQSIATSPNQGPTAALSVSRSSGGGRSITVDGGASSDADGSVATYTFDYGDGTVETGASPTGSHSYSAPGDYTVRLTVVDDEGCSTSIVTTGQTVSCNGTSSAVATARADLDPPSLKLSGPRRQELGRRVKVVATCDEACTARGRGSLVVKHRNGGAPGARASSRFKLKPAKRNLAPGVKGKLRLRVPSAARRFVAEAAERGPVKATARIRVKARDAAGNSNAANRRVQLRSKDA